MARRLRSGGAAHELTAEDRAKGGHARAERLRAEREEERRLLAEARRANLDEAIEKLSAAAERAAAAIDELLGATSETVRLKAAVSVLELLLESEVREMLGRVERLEAMSGNGR